MWNNSTTVISSGAWFSSAASMASTRTPWPVELAKVSLWLHTFTVGAPLSFLDHHLRCGDSLFGSWVRNGIDKATEQGGALFLQGPAKNGPRGLRLPCRSSRG